MRTANPALNEETFKNLAYSATKEEAMTIQGTVNKTGILLLLTLLSAIWTWNKFFASGTPESVMPWTMIGAFGGFIVALVTIFKKTWSPLTAPVYGILEGLLLGGFSAIFESQFPGIVIQTVALTFGTLLCLLLAYQSGIIKATENFKLGVVSATGAIALFYLITIILGFFGIRMPFIHESGVIGIGLSLFIVIVAALNLVLDFDFIERGAETGVPKYMEWYAAFSLMVTLIWLYLEILRLLAKLRRRD